MKYIKFFIGAVAVAGVIFGFIKLPQRVDALAEEQERTEDRVQQVAQTLESYIQTQQAVDLERQKQEEERRQAQERREALMLELIRKE